MNCSHQATLQILHDNVYAAKLRLKTLNRNHAPLPYIVAQRDRVDRAERALRDAEREAWPS